jgi:hypothetical protein
MKFLHKTTPDGSSSYLVYEEDFSDELDELAFYFGCLELGDDSWYRFRPSGNLLTAYELSTICSKLSELNHEQWQAMQDILKNPI